ncbi:MAG: Gfo/Idh/MocA family oxidoreductase [Xanthomonadales bacterium]|nr:Gfo/Idh/MocA family oxidoreductase [Gammaproteobacteria bacterium]MBT8052896.1 Gfo/Idh/MocA family oxidoreductase [Gammaproteobacteria bacterium]NND57651.1 Gfo/Idh/MocA family oxidoreductase [Xanthomonadales bacterium]NNK51575.1 Gfo/Idh/MocA family oxidoreductase [Xanthomonadales bacterium]
MKNEISHEGINTERRKLLVAAGAGALAATIGGSLRAEASKTLRWGVVGTGGIANSMAPRIQQAENAELAAVSSRRMSSAREFADKHRLNHTFDSWTDMLAFDGIDAVYVATPTSVREEICIAAAQAGKHVLGEKPFANLPSLQRITAACRSNGVGFMDGTHFPHHPRTAHIKTNMVEQVGWPWSLASAFQFGLADTGNIRYNPDLEPYGAIGDAGWYNMRAAAEYLPTDLEISSVEAFMRRSKVTGAAVAGSGVIIFNDGSSTTWNCGFESGAGVMDLRISGVAGVIKLDDFLSQRRSDQAGVYQHLKGWGNSETVVIPSKKPGSSLMFEDFATMVGDPELFEASVQVSERTQALLDATWNSAIENESA